ncbi:NUDIX domain-containing protein [Halosegnis longus]|uniref:NUDIX domain-containing protein n=1 Tax=Halosegnis longus TaxID=2216012 RepID=UPI0018F47CDC
MPTVFVDLLIRIGLLFGKRTNEPVKGYWFPPGGRVRKFEMRKDAIHRVAREECGMKSSSRLARSSTCTRRPPSMAETGNITWRTATS